jgi:hypothetical protein
MAANKSEQTTTNTDNITTKKRGRPRKVLSEEEKNKGRNKYMDYYRDYNRERYQRQKIEKQKLEEEKEKIWKLYCEGKLAKVKRIHPFENITSVKVN